jgi:hypothetical protein
MIEDIGPKEENGMNELPSLEGESLVDVESKSKLDVKQWIADSVVRVEGINPGNKIEIIIPEEVNPIDFIIALGLPQRDYEIGGLYNTESRSMLMTRGAGAEERGLANPQVEFMRPRRNEDQSTDDIYFHTHPWDEKGAVSYYRKPENACNPSGTDTNNALAISMIEEEAGQSPEMVSIISSGGYFTKTEVKGTNIDETTLVQSGITDEQARKIRVSLALDYPQWMLNRAKDEKSSDSLAKLLSDFYAKRKQNLDVPFGIKVRDLRKQMEDFFEVVSRRGIPQNASYMIAESIESHFPEYLSGRMLKDLGLNEEQIQVVQGMLGVKITKYKQTETGLVEVE